MAAPVPATRTLLLLLLQLLPTPGAHGEMCMASSGNNLFPKSCPVFCCGTCYIQYCCSDMLKKFVWSKENCADFEESFAGVSKQVEENVKPMKSSLRDFPDIDSDPMSGFGATVAIGVSIFVLFIVTIIVCFTCSCCCLYKMCCPPRPVVTNTTATTVVHAPYIQTPSVPPSYPGPSSYQGYHPIPPQPGMAAAPYPTQNPPPYPAQPMGPPAYHQVAGGAVTPYSASQPPYNPAYMDPPKATH